jgi:4'-phosphopantetheinyl transferase EntD
MFVRRLPHPFGALVTVAFPDEHHPPPEGALHPEELAHAATLAPARRVTWVGGRVALRAALAQLGADAPQPILATPRKAPMLPAGFVGSITHKRGLAAALAARADEPLRTLGLDLEIAAPLRTDIAARILGEDELAALAGLTGPARDVEVLRRFAAKEAIYKALDPWVSRYVTFREATVVRAPDGTLTATLALPPAEGTFRVELHDASADDLILIAARIAR